MSTRPAKDHVEVLLALAEVWRQDDDVLSVLLVPRQGERQPGRYQSPVPLSLEQVATFCRRFTPFLQGDGQRRLADLRGRVPRRRGRRRADSHPAGSGSTRRASLQSLGTSWRGLPWVKSRHVLAGNSLLGQSEVAAFCFRIRKWVMTKWRRPRIPSPHARGEEQPPALIPPHGQPVVHHPSDRQAEIPPKTSFSPP